jgi:cell division transport system permease protein
MKPKKRETFKARPNYVYAIISEALILFVIGLLAAVLLKSNEWLQQYRENIDIMVEIKQDAPRENIRNLIAILETHPQVLPRSVSFISKEAGAELLRQDFGEDFANLGLPNPLHDVITFNLPSEALRQDNLKQLRQEITQLPGVHDLFYQELFLDQAFSNLSRIGEVSLLLSALLLFLAYHLVYNTFRLALYANRFLIKNMEMVGASWAHISRPFLRRALLYGLSSSLLAVVGIALLLEGSAMYLGIAALAGFDLPLLLLYTGILLLGTGIAVLSTYRVVRRYLKLRMDDLY